MSTLPEWPDKRDFISVPTWVDMAGNTVVTEPYFDELNYERARAGAAMARLRVAVEALHDMACWSEGDFVNGSFDEPGSAQQARVTLDAIGPLPSTAERE